MTIEEQFRLIGELLTGLRDEVRSGDVLVKNWKDGSWDVDTTGLREEKDSDQITSVPALELTRSLYAAVTKSVDEDTTALHALSKLQNSVLVACARFECATVIV